MHELMNSVKNISMVKKKKKGREISFRKLYEKNNFNCISHDYVMIEADTISISISWDIINSHEWNMIDP